MIFERVRKIIARQLNVPETKITLESRIVEDLAADSLDIIEMITEVESEFNISVDDESAESLKTVGDIVTVLEKLNVKK